MKHYPYLIIGGGLAAYSAIKGIRSETKDEKIGIISEENYLPYDRPTLSKKLWSGTDPEKIFHKEIVDGATTFHLNRKVVSINSDKHEVIDDKGDHYRYKKLLLATGGKPRRLDLDADIIYLRQYSDYLRIKSLTSHGINFLVIGGGFIGTEIASSLCMNGKKVSLALPESSIGEKIYSKNFSSFLNALFIEKGVRLYTNTRIEKATRSGMQYKVRLHENELLFDGIIAGIGIEPSVELALAANIQVSDGILVNEHLETSCEDVFAAGDNANFYSPLLSKRVRVEHEDNALHMGFLAGRNMAGANEPYLYHPFFYTDLFDIGYEAIGEISSKMDIIEDFEDPYRKGTFYYLSEGMVRGAISVGVWNQIDRIKELISKKEPFVLSSL